MYSPYRLRKAISISYSLAEQDKIWKPVLDSLSVTFAVLAIYYGVVKGGLERYTRAAKILTCVSGVVGLTGIVLGLIALGNNLMIAIP